MTRWLWLLAFTASVETGAAVILAATGRANVATVPATIALLALVAFVVERKGIRR